MGLAPPHWQDKPEGACGAPHPSPAAPKKGRGARGVHAVRPPSSSRRGRRRGCGERHTRRTGRGTGEDRPHRPLGTSYFGWRQLEARAPSVTPNVKGKRVGWESGQEAPAQSSGGGHTDVRKREAHALFGLLPCFARHYPLANPAFQEWATGFTSCPFFGFTAPCSVA